jgi:homoserine dehydrogenase
MDTLKLCFIGFGNVGQKFSGLLLDKKDWLRDTFGREVLVTGIAGRSKGSLINPDGIDLAAALEEVKTQGHFADGPARFDGTPVEMMAASGADVLVEMSTLSIKDGLPAADHIRYALRHGMHVITANKGPEAWYYNELKELAEKEDRQFLYETIVLDGTPTFNLMTETLHGNTVSGITGILNGTSNYVLKLLEEGKSYEEAIKAAQDIGLAEADPSMDIDGWDGAAKICAMANILMDAHITPDDVEVESVRSVTAEDLADAKGRGMCIKYICRAEQTADGVKVSVKPEELPREHAYNSVNGTSAVFTLFTDLAGELTIIQTDPGLLQTAYGLYSDLITLLKRL